MITYSQANQISIKAYLASKGIYPVKDHGYYGMYHSPFREDRNASLKVDYNKNLWIDFGDNNGGTMIDIVMCLNNYTLQEAMNELSQYYMTSVSQHNNTIVQQQSDSFSFQGKIEIERAIELTHPALLQYLDKRAINLDVAKAHCSEIHYSVNNKPYFAIGFQHDSTGWVLRSEPFKGCTSMDIRTYRNTNKSKDTCLIFEGFMDYLSYLTLKNIHKAQEDVIVLNSLSNLPKAINQLKDYKETHIYLDNDEAGKKATQLIKQSCSTVIDQSVKYTNHKDLNEYLISTQIEKKVKPVIDEKRKPSRGFRC